MSSQGEQRAERLHAVLRTWCRSAMPCKEARRSAPPFWPRASARSGGCPLCSWLGAAPRWSGRRRGVRRRGRPRPRRPFMMPAFAHKQTFASSTAASGSAVMESMATLMTPSMANSSMMPTRCPRGCAALRRRRPSRPRRRTRQRSQRPRKQRSRPLKHHSVLGYGGARDARTGLCARDHGLACVLGVELCNGLGNGLGHGRIRLREGGDVPRALDGGLGNVGKLANVDPGKIGQAHVGAPSGQRY